MPRPDTPVGPVPISFNPDGFATAEQLVDRAVAGDRHSLNALLAHVHPLVVRYCRARLAPHHQALATADDVAQDVCMALIRALPSYNGQGSPFLAFVFGIAAHKVADARRAVLRAPLAAPVAELPETATEEGDPERLAVLGSVSETIGKMLSALPPAQQEILRMRVIVGLSADETAQALGMTAVAVRVAQHRALARMRTLLAEDPFQERLG